MVDGVVYGIGRCALFHFAKAGFYLAELSQVGAVVVESVAEEN